MEKEKYIIRPLNPKNAKKIVNWNEGGSQDFLMQWAGRAFVHPITVEQVVADMKVCNTVFEIIYEEEMIGTIAFINVDEKVGSAYIGHFLLNPELKGKGHGTAILQEFIIYCFGILKLKELTLKVFDYNKGALRCYEKNGFAETERVKTENGLEVLTMSLKKTKIESSNQTPIVICDETPEDWDATELMTQHAFWNLHWPGCNEHLLVSNLRKSKEYIPELSKIAKIGNEVVGAILYSTAYVISPDGKKYEVLTFGPLCVEPKYQSLGIGGKLLLATMEDARKAGYPAIIIFGEPYYYPRFGFKTCDHFGITAEDGTNADPFMGIELQPDALAPVTGKFYEADVFGDRPQEEVDEYDNKFPTLQKYRLPGQWQ